MVTNRLCLPVMAAIAFLAVSPIQAKDLADYRVGDVAETDITTPVALEVIDAEATQALKDRESRRGIIMFCFYPGWAAESEAELRSSFAQTRSNFLSVIEMMFRQRKLGPQDLASTNFHQVAAAFQKQNALFPVDIKLAGLWAGGEPDANYESNVVAQLRQTMMTPVRSDYVPEGIKVGTTVRLLTVTNAVTPTVEMAAQFGVDLHKTNLHSIPRSKMWLQQRFPREQAAVAEHVATFVKPNCFIDVGLTRGLRLKAIEGLWTGDRFEAGQTIVKRGEAIDKRAGAALELLAEKMAVSQLQQAIADDQVKTAQARKQFWLLIGGFSLGFVVSVIAVWKLARRRASTLLPARIGGGDADTPLTVRAADGIWQERAISAEKRAEKANAVIRAGLVSHLGRWLSNTFVQKVIVQRAQLLDTQKKAVSEMDELGERLDTIHNRMQDRLTAYELQIAELEKKLDAKDEMNRELIRTEIASIKRQMKSEQTGDEMELAEWRPGVK